MDITIPDELWERLEKAYPDDDAQVTAIRAIKKVVGEAELRQFAAAKRREIDAEAQRLNQELGL